MNNIVGENFPLTRAARKQKLDEVKKGSSISTKKVPGKGTMSVFRIPLNCLSYNPHNTRFLSHAKTLERRFGQELNDESSEHIQEIEKVIWSEKEDRNEATIDSLIKNGQIDPGVVTADGIVLSGNRRFRLLNEIIRNPDKYSSSRNSTAGLNFFEAVILDEENLSKRDIVRYESFYQFGIEEKVEYNPIQKYIAAKDQKGLGFSEQEIANNFITITKGKKSEVEKWLKVYDLMTEYLDHIGEDGIFTALEGREEAFLRLLNDLKSFKGAKGAKMWAFSEDDLSSLKLIFFDFIRLNIPTHDFRLFKNIFSDESQWKEFEKNVEKVASEVSDKLESFEEYRQKNSEESEAVVSKIRQCDYIDLAEKKLNRLYGVEKARDTAKTANEEPIEILNSIKVKLSKLEEKLNSSKDIRSYQTDEFAGAVRELQRRIGKIKQQID